MLRTKDCLRATKKTEEEEYDGGRGKAIPTVLEIGRSEPGRAKNISSGGGPQNSGGGKKRNLLPTGGGRKNGEDLRRMQGKRVSLPTMGADKKAGQCCTYAKAPTMGAETMGKRE